MGEYLALEDRFYIKLVFDGQAYPLNPRTIKEISMLENIKNNLPTCAVKLRDQTGWLMNTRPLLDGSEISIEMSDDLNGSKENATFYNFSLEGEPEGDTMRVNVYGLLNSPAYFRGMADTAIQGNSNEVISQVAAKVGLNPVTDSFSDAMVWIPLHDKNWEWVHKIADHGWAGADGATSVGVDLLGNLHYRNLSQVVGTGSKREIVYGIPKEEVGKSLHMLHYAIKSTSGALNSISAYNATTSMPDWTGKLMNFLDTPVKLISGFLNMSPKIKTAMGQSARTYLPANAGNVHVNYANAQHTNMRGRATWGLTVHGLFEEMTGLHLYDMVDVRIYENVNHPMPPQLNGAYSGRYMVSAKSCVTNGSVYRERLELSAQGSQSSGW